MKQLIHKIFNRFGYRIVKEDVRLNYPDLEPDFWRTFRRCEPYTMTSIDRMYALYKAVQYLIDKEIEGDLVECGVWKGGSAMLMAEVLQKNGLKDKKLFLYDTFEGMSPPSDNDVDFRGLSAEQLLDASTREEERSVWCYAPIDEVRANMIITGYPAENTNLVEGKVEDTIPGIIPEKIALLRLDTDWYESTYHELLHLFPRLSSGGVLIIDDYGHWEGSKKAVDDYFSEHSIQLLLNRIDYTGRIAVKA